MPELAEYQDKFIELQPALRSYLYRLMAVKQEAEDLTQDTYLKVFKSLHQFKGKSSFKTWVFSIATNLARDQLRKTKRWQVDYQDNCRTATYRSQKLRDTMAGIVQQAPHGKYVIKEHIDFCFTCMSKTLSLEQQISMMLKDIYQFKISEIMQIMHLSEGKVKHALADARNTLRSIFDHRCSLVNQQGVCYQCTELNGILNPRQDAQQEAMRLKMVKERGKANYRRLLELRKRLVRQIDPLNAEGSDLHNYMLENLPEYQK